MRLLASTASLVLGLSLCIAGTARAVDPDDALLLAQPDISARHVVFAYDNDLWIVDRAGGRARRLTTMPGAESLPHFSPGGRLVAFSNDGGGNADVHVVPVAGGEPVRLTWHGGPDVVQGFLPDGRIVFSSYRALPTERMIQLFAVSVSGGMPERLPVPDGDDSQVAPNGLRIAYSTMAPLYKDAVPQSKRYRGGNASRIWIMDFDDYAVQEIPQPRGGSNDLNPVWIDGEIYFSSDRNGEFNLFAFDPRSARVRQLSRHETFPVLNLNGGGGRLVYEHAGALHVFDPAPGRSRRLRIAVDAELRETRPRKIRDPDFVRAVVPSPKMDWVAVEYRGEIIVMQVDSGAFRNLTRSPDAHDRSPAWSADGRHIAWFSDQSGEYMLHIRSPDGVGDARRIALDGAGFYENLKWSPDGRYLSYRDNSLTLYVVDAQSGQVRRIAQEPDYTPAVSMQHTWSPDSQWLAYTVKAHGLIQTLHLYSIAQRRSWQVSDGFVDITEPVFDPARDVLYVAASIDAGPVRDWFTQSKADQSVSRTLYAIALDSMDSASAATATGLDRKLAGRAFPATTGRIDMLRVGRAGEIFWLGGPDDGPRHLFRLRTASETGEPEQLLDEIDDYRLSADGTRILYRQDAAWTIAPLTDIDDASATLALDEISVRTEPRAEWRQIAREAWRIKRDYFYDPNHHGVDWDAVWSRYEPFIEHAATRADIDRIMFWMSTELAVGHSYVFPPPDPNEPERDKPGLLGADFEIAQGRHRFAKVYRLHWTPDLVAPLDLPDTRVEDGEYLLAIDGRSLDASDNIYRFLDGKAGQDVTLRVGPHADGRQSRTIVVEPIEDETALRRMDWIEGNLRRVDAASGGRVAYVHVPDTHGRGHGLFKRYFYPQSHKQAIILDARFNGGGSFPDYYIDMLRKAHIGYFATRYGEDLRIPRGAIRGPRVMIVNEMARSGGDLLAYMFRKLELGPIVGTTTTGAMVGNLGVPRLMDGGIVTAPNFGFWTREDGWAVENVGVAPDIEVEQWPAAVNAGLDPQLEAAIDTAMDLLRNQPAPARGPAAVRPPYPEP